MIVLLMVTRRLVRALGATGEVEGSNLAVRVEVLTGAFIQLGLEGKGIIHEMSVWEHKSVGHELVALSHISV